MVRHCINSCFFSKLCMMTVCFIGLGTNVGDRLNNLALAQQSIALHVGNILKISSVYETEPWGFQSEMWFYNQIIAVETNCTTEALLRILLDIEAHHGRVRTTSPTYAPRVIDLDLLLFDDIVISVPGLVIPHPRLHLRKFVLAPLAEIAPDVKHPVMKKTIKELFAECLDEYIVRKV